MHFANVFSLLGIVWVIAASTNGMKCRTNDDNDDDNNFRDIVRTCSRGGQDGQGGRGGQGNADESDNKQHGIYNGRNSGQRYDSQNHQHDHNRNSHQIGGRNKNGNDNRNDDNHNNRNNNNNDNRDNNNDYNNHNRNNQNNNQNNNNQNNGNRHGSQLYDRHENNYNNRNSTMDDDIVPLEQMQPCTVHCIFKHMRMLNDEEFPDKYAVTSELASGIHNQQVRRFIEESVEDCYDNLQQKHWMEKCEFAKSLALCFQDKGRRTCEDWDDSTSSQTNSNNNGNNNYHYIQQY